MIEVIVVFYRWVVCMCLDVALGGCFVGSLLLLIGSVYLFG